MAVKPASALGKPLATLVREKSMRFLLRNFFWWAVPLAAILGLASLLIWLAQSEVPPPLYTDF